MNFGLRQMHPNIQSRGWTGGTKLQTRVTGKFFWCKMMERVITWRILEHPERINLVTKRHHGFRMERWWLGNLIKFYGKEREAWVDRLFLDCQKAFDTVCPS